MLLFERRMVHCAAYNCLHDTRKTKGISFYKFPSDDQRRKQWIKNLRLEGFTVKDHSRVCQIHFDIDCFERSPELLKSLGLDVLEKCHRPKLKSNAVPTIFYRGSSKARCQVRGKQTFADTKTKVKAKFKGRLSMSPGLSPRLSPSKGMRIGLALGRCSKKYGAFTKRRRIEVSYECQVHNYLESPSCSLRLTILFLILTSYFYGP